MISTILYAKSYVNYSDEILENGSSWKICPTRNTETFAANKFCSTLSLLHFILPYYPYQTILHCQSNSYI